MAVIFSSGLSEYLPTLEDTASFFALNGEHILSVDIIVDPWYSHFDESKLVYSAGSGALKYTFSVGSQIQAQWGSAVVYETGPEILHGMMFESDLGTLNSWYAKRVFSGANWVLNLNATPDSHYYQNLVSYENDPPATAATEVVDIVTYLTAFDLPGYRSAADSTHTSVGVYHIDNYEAMFSGGPPNFSRFPSFDEGAVASSLLQNDAYDPYPPSVASSATFRNMYDIYATSNFAFMMRKFVPTSIQIAFEIDVTAVSMTPVDGSISIRGAATVTWDGGSADITFSSLSELGSLAVQAMKSYASATILAEYNTALLQTFV